MSQTRLPIELVINGKVERVLDRGQSLMSALRHDLGLTGVKDGCSPQGQCGCCTVLVDGAPRVSCVTPLRRVKGRTVVTIEGLGPDRQQTWASALTSTGGTQCGFCTPGIVMRLEAQLGDCDEGDVVERTERALAAHLCRCTGWQTIAEAATLVTRGSVIDHRSTGGAERRAEIEGGVPQDVGNTAALGGGGFAADTVPAESLVAVPTEGGGWAVAESFDEARAAAGIVPGRRTTAPISWPLAIPDGDWTHTMRTTWVEPAYLDLDAAWCRPGAEPSSSNPNGGAFGAKADSPVRLAAKELSESHGRPVLAIAGREDITRWGPKRPPMAGGVRSDGTGVIHVAATPGIVDAILSAVPGFEVREFEVAGPSTSSEIRGAGWVEATVLGASVNEPDWIRSPAGGSALATIEEGEIRVRVRCGDPLDETILRSYCIGAAHMAWSWLMSESLTVQDGEVLDLTVRSFGIMSAREMPTVVIEIEDEGAEPVNGSDAVFAAVAAAGWITNGCSQDWPIGATMEE